jgi:hypothetical protein
MAALGTAGWSDWNLLAFSGSPPLSDIVSSVALTHMGCSP